MRTTSSAVTVQDCIIEASCSSATHAFTGGRLVRCHFKGLGSGVPVYTGAILSGCLVENCTAGNWPSGAGYHCTLRKSGIVGNNYLCIAFGGVTSTAIGRSKHAGSLYWNDATAITVGTGYATDDPLFVSSTGVAVRRSSPAFTCGEVPTAENYGAEYYKHVSTDFYGRPLTFVDGKPVAGADQLGVFEIFARRDFTVTDATPSVVEAADGAISLPQGGRLVASAAAGSSGDYDLVLLLRVPADGSLSIFVNGEAYDFDAGEHRLKIQKTPSAVELLVSADAGTSTILSLRRDVGMAIMVQ